jgi:uncharacterized repeat protein (TIGR03803 family)
MELPGTTGFGGAPGYGVVFKLTPHADGRWTESILHAFMNNPGASPSACSLMFDAAGALYGPTYRGGAAGDGVVYKMTPHTDGSWTYSSLHVFLGKPGANPVGSLVLDKTGNLYGTTGGCGSSGCAGVVFEITP